MKNVLAIALVLALCTISACNRDSVAIGGPDTPDQPGDMGPISHGRCPGCADVTPPDAGEPASCGALDQGCCPIVDGSSACNDGLVCDVSGACEPPPSACGGYGQGCCLSGDACEQGLICNDAGICDQQVPNPCGAQGQACCSTSPACSGDLICIEGACEPLPPLGCGGAGQACCDEGDSCGTGLVCFDGTCQSNGPTCDAGFAYSECVLTQGYYRTHACLPLSYLTLGSVVYSAAQVQDILNAMPNGNGLIALAHQLIAAKLNVADGASAPAGIATADADIGALIVPPVGSGFLDPIPLESLISNLDAFNMGNAGTPHCN